MMLIGRLNAFIESSSKSATLNDSMFAMKRPFGITSTVHCEPLVSYKLCRFKGWLETVMRYQTTYSSRSYDSLLELMLRKLLSLEQINAYLSMRNFYFCLTYSFFWRKYPYCDYHYGEKLPAWGTRSDSPPAFVPVCGQMQMDLSKTRSQVK